MNLKYFTSFKFLILYCLAGLVGLFFYFDFDSWIQFDVILREKEKLLNLYHSHPIVFILGFLLFYIFYATCSLPGAALLSLTSGFIFHFVIGSLVVIAGSVTGASFSFLISRYLFRDYIQKKFRSGFHSINEGFKKNGFFYLLSLRLIPAIPFFIVNIVMGVTSISLKHYVLASFFGMLPGIFVYVNAGRQIASLESASDVLSFRILISFLLLAFLPWLVKYMVSFFHKYKNLKAG